MDAVTFIIMAVGFSMMATAIIVCIEDTLAEAKEEEDGR